MRLPEAIERAIDREATAVPGKTLARAAEALSLRYRERVSASGPQTSRMPSSAPALTDVERLAYAIVRAPATYAAAAVVLAELAQRAPDLRIESLLDLGSGPGAATWAALAQRDDITHVTLIERDRGFIDLGRRVLHVLTDAGPDSETRPQSEAQGEGQLQSQSKSQSEWQSELQSESQSRSRSQCQWQCADLRALPNLPEHDLVIMSYSLGELRDDDRDRGLQDACDAASRGIIERAWAATRRALIVIEPGTPFHFNRLLTARAELIRAGAFIAAPCPHASACPMASVNDWCHMPARVERTSLHRRLKAAALPYEDEKFSYVIATREPVERAAARIVRRPEIQKGFVTLTLCTPDGLQREGVTRSDRDAFRRARKADWGDAF